MEIWAYGLQQWREQLKGLCPQVGFLPMGNSASPRAGEVWTCFGDDFQLFDVAQFLASPRTQLKSFDQKHSDSLQKSIQIVTEQSQERLLDSYRYLLADRLEELLPAGEWVKVLIEKRFFRKNSQGGGFQWKPPVSTKGLVRLCESFLASFQARIHEVAQDCLSALYTRVGRVREEINQAWVQEGKPALVMSQLFFERRFRDTVDQLVLCPLIPLKAVIAKTLSELPEKWNGEEQLRNHLSQLVSKPQWPMNTQDLIQNGMKIQAVLYGTFLVLGIITEHELQGLKLWSESYERSNEKTLLKEARL